MHVQKRSEDRMKVIQWLVGVGAEVNIAQFLVGVRAEVYRPIVYISLYGVEAGLRQLATDCLRVFCYSFVAFNLAESVSLCALFGFI